MTGDIVVVETGTPFLCPLTNKVRTPLDYTCPDGRRWHLAVPQDGVLYVTQETADWIDDLDQQCRQQAAA